MTVSNIRFFPLEKEKHREITYQPGAKSTQTRSNRKGESIMRYALAKSKKVKSMIAAITASVAMVTATMSVTFCTGIQTLDNAKSLIFKLGQWAGGILAFIGIALVGKSVLDSTSGNSQPGQLQKALGLLVLGAILLAGATILQTLGA